MVVRTVLLLLLLLLLRVADDDLFNGLILEIVGGRL